VSEKLPALSGKDAMKPLGKAGFRVVRQRGSRMRLEKTEAGAVIRSHGTRPQFTACLYTKYSKQ